MTCEEFNNKWTDYKELGHYGLDINIPSVIEYLDEKFKELITIPDYKYTQIKLKFNTTRVYMYPKSIDTGEIELNIDKLVMDFENKGI